VQVLTAAALRLGLLRSRAPSDLADELAQIERLVSQSLRDVRSEMEALRDPTDPDRAT
jgi:signal transduction histidine kinase